MNSSVSVWSSFFALKSNHAHCYAWVTLGTHAFTFLMYKKGGVTLSGIGKKYYCNQLGIINTSYFVFPLSLTRSSVLTSRIRNFLFLCKRMPRSKRGSFKWYTNLHTSYTKNLIVTQLRIMYTFPKTFSIIDSN